ncbi:MAG: amidohydrolase family protein [Chloroflexi bacterium]|nr:amidohydrolase family protein [Chloroflexota bacterium]MCY3937411.1 amidohydrolase family protein [Chloroflexota bacterium]
MRVDVHAHCIQPEHVTAAAHSKMERSGYPPMAPTEFDHFMREMEPVDKAICFGVRARGTGTMTPDEYTSEWVSRAPEKLLGFMAIDPMEEDYLEKIDRAASELGLCGIKLHPILGRYNPADPKIFPLYEKAIDLGLPILTHMGAHPDDRVSLKQSEPLLFDDVAQAFSELKIVIAHMAHPWQRDCAVVLRKHPNVYADVSGAGWVRPWQAWQALTLMVEWGVADKLLFGSDFPFWTPREGFDKLRRLNEQVEGTGFPRIPDDVIEGIINRDALGLLGIG